MEVMRVFYAWTQREKWFFGRELGLNEIGLCYLICVTEDFDEKQVLVLYGQTDGVYLSYVTLNVGHGIRFMDLRSNI